MISVNEPTEPANTGYILPRQGSPRPDNPAIGKAQCAIRFHSHYSVESYGNRLGVPLPRRPGCRRSSRTGKVQYSTRARRERGEMPRAFDTRIRRDTGPIQPAGDVDNSRNLRAEYPALKAS